MEKIKRKNEKGITLIALIITIIILVILAAVSINAAYNSGIINYAVNGTQQYVEGAHDEQSRIASAGELMDSVMARLEHLQGGGNSNGGSTSINIVQPTLPTATVAAGETASVNSTYTDGAGKKAVIPEGFTVSGIAAEQSIDTGLVIYDLGGANSSATGFWTSETTENGVTCPEVQTTYNQFVWVPVAAPYITASQLQTLVNALDTDAIETQLEADLVVAGEQGFWEFLNSLMGITQEQYTSKTLAEKFEILYGESLERYLKSLAIQSLESNGIYPMAIKVSNTDYRGILYDWQAMYDEGANDGEGGYVWSDSINVLPFSTTDNYQNVQYDREPAYLTDDEYADASSYNKYGLTQSVLQEEYAAMVESVAANGGFWVARYELTTNTSARITRAQTVANAYDGATITWYGLYYACRNMYNSTTDAAQSIMITGSQYDQIMLWMKNVSNGSSKYILDSTGKGNYSGSVAVSGSNANYAAKQVFDLAGNLWEWTGEASGGGDRTGRGGHYRGGGSGYVAAARGGYCPCGNYQAYGTRSSLYVKSAKTNVLTTLEYPAN